MGTERKAEYYDKIYISSEGYAQHYAKSRYFALWTEVGKQLFELRRAKKELLILEVGCGTGQFAEMLFDNQLPDTYVGIDFSFEAIRKAKARTNYSFRVADARNQDVYFRLPLFNTVIALEIFEHTDDMQILSLLKSGTTVIATVPDFDDPAHVRHFKTLDEVQTRYEKKLNITHLIKIQRWYLFVGTKK